MRRKFKRNITSILSFLVLEFLFLKSVLRIDINNIESIKVIQVVNFIGALVVAGLILRFIFFPYIVFDERSITINHNFTKDTFLISDIEEVDVDDGRFKLKSGKSIKFNSFMLGNKSMKALKEFFRELRLIQ